MTRISNLRAGVYQEALRYVGRKSGPLNASFPISQAMSQVFCALLEDSNPVYWDVTAARKCWGDGLLSPAALLHTWCMPLPWSPDGDHRPETLSLLIPLPGTTIINVATESRHFRPLPIGMQITFDEEILAISPEKATRLGVGHFVETLGTYHDRDGAEIGTILTTQYRYTPAGNITDMVGDDRRVPETRDVAGKRWSTASEGGAPCPIKQKAGSLVSESALSVRPELVSGLASATLDYFPGHHDLNYALEQGVRGTYLNTFSLTGFVDRVVTDWAGPKALITKRRLRMLHPVHAGDELRGELYVLDEAESTCVGRWEDRTPVTVQVAASTEDGICCEAEMCVVKGEEWA